MTTLEDIRRILKDKVETHGPVKVGEDLGFSHPYISKTCKKGAAMSDRLIGALGFEKIVKYRRVK